MIPINRTFAPLQAFVDELVRCGLHHAVTSPGSRNAPLILTLAGHPSLDCVSVIDERSAGFVALGIAKSTRRPVAITCTSGTAAANLAPAVIEAREACVPLIVLTADRPPELRDVGAGPLPLARVPRVVHGRGRAPRAGAPQLPAARAACALTRGAAQLRLGRAQRWTTLGRGLRCPARSVADDHRAARARRGGGRAR